MIENNTIKFPVTYKGKTYKNFAEISRHLGVAYSTMKYRLRNGETNLDEILKVTHGNNKGRSKPVTVNGETFESMDKACLHYNIAYSVVRNRLSRGWDLERAFTSNASRQCSIAVNDTNTGEVLTFDCLADACRHYDVKYVVASKRIERGWTVEEALNLVNRTTYAKNKPITVEGEMFPSITSACRYYRKNYNIVYSKLYRGLSVEEAFDLK